MKPLRTRGRIIEGCFALAACAGCSPPEPSSIASGPRDWVTHPAIAEVTPGSRVFAISDVHGAYDRMIALFAKNGLIEGVPLAPDAVRWTGADAVLVVAGDLIDKGTKGVEVIDALRALEAS